MHNRINNGTEMGRDRNGHGTEVAGPKCPASHELYMNMQNNDKSHLPSER